MKPYEFLTVMKNNLSTDGQTQKDFLECFFESFIDQINQETLEKAGHTDVAHPFSSRGWVTNASKYFQDRPTGRTIPIKKAQFLLSNFNSAKFVEKLYSLPQEVLDNLKSTLYSMGVNVLTTDELGPAISSLYSGFLNAAINKETQIDLLEVNKNLKESRNAPSSPNGLEVPSEGAVYKDGCISIGNQLIKLPPALQTSQLQNNQASPYVNALKEIYAEKGQKITTADPTDSLTGRYKKHFIEHRKAFCSAEILRHSMRELFIDGEAEFEKLETDAYDGISPIYCRDFPTGFDRFQEVTSKITSTTLTASRLSNIKNLYGNREKKGLCHMLVNDRLIKSWVNIDD